MEEKDVSGVDRNPASGMSDSRDGAPTEDSENVREHAEAPLGGSSEPDAPTMDLRQGNSEMRAGCSLPPSRSVAPTAGFPTLSVQLPSSLCLWVQHTPPVSSFDKNYTASQAAVADCGRHGDPPYDQPHRQCARRGDSRKDSEAVSETRLASMDAEE